jgi:hypothetical protein
MPGSQTMNRVKSENAASNLQEDEASINTPERQTMSPNRESSSKITKPARSCHYRCHTQDPRRKRHLRC